MLLVRWALLVLGALLMLASVLCCWGFRLAMKADMLYPPRIDPLDILDSGDLLFFNPRMLKSSFIQTFARLVTKGALGTPYSHVSVVYRDVKGFFGPKDALYSFEYCSAKGGPVLFPLRTRARKSLRHLLCRELLCSPQRPAIDRDALDAFVLKSTEHTRHHGLLSGSGSVWARSTIERHILFMCPDPRTGGTCADNVLRFLEAAKLWSADDGCFCTSVTDLLSGDGPESGLPPFAPAELVVKVGGIKKSGKKNKKLSAG